MPEFAESKIQRADSNLETVESEVHYFYSTCNVQSHFYSTPYGVPNQGRGGVECPKKQNKTKQSKNC